MRIAVPLALVSLLIAACGTASSDAADSSTVSELAPTRSEPEVSSTEPLQSGNLALPVTAGLQRAAAEADAPVEALAAGWNNAGFELLRRLPVDDNVVFSPTSIGHALLMAAAAGDDATRSAIESAFGLPDRAHEAWNSIDDAIATSQSNQLTVTIADRIWPRIGIEPDQQWVDLLAAQHGADVVPLDYINQPDASRAIINDWVSDRTDALIPELLPAGVIDPATVLVPNDAVYFAAEWATPFGKYGPVDGTFTTIDGDKVDVSFMQQLELDDRSGIGDGYVGAEMPHAGGEYSMLLLVPDAGRYNEVLDRLDQSLLDEIDNTFTTGPYELLVPQWDHSYQINLLDWLTDIGAAPGEYPNISPDAFLGAAVHAADIAVDEHGTVAAAATGLNFAMSEPSASELTVAADRPFIYLIRHRESGLVLFVGHVTDPT